MDWRRDPPIRGAGYEPAGISVFSRAERSHKIYSGAVQYRPDIIPTS